MTEAVYRLVGEQLEADVADVRAKSVARRVGPREGQTWAEWEASPAGQAHRAIVERESAAFDARCAASDGAADAVRLSPGVLGITDPDPGEPLVTPGLGAPYGLTLRSGRTAFERETLEFRRRKALRHLATATERRAAADLLVRSVGLAGGGLPGRFGDARPASPAGEPDETGHPTQEGEAEPWTEDLDELKERHRHLEASAAWHEGRARGEVERQIRLDECSKGDTWALSTCRIQRRGCGDMHLAKVSCGSKFCVSCRARAAALSRQRFAVGRWKRLEQIKRRGLLRKVRPGGRWTEKFATFTVPHISSWHEIGTPRRADVRERLELFRGKIGLPAGVEGPYREDAIAGARIWLLYEAWRAFSNRWNAFFRSEFSSKIRVSEGEVRPGKFSRDHLSRGLVALHKAFEWTPAADGLGHPHFHVYVWSPFVDRELVTQWWREALEEIGYQGEALPIMPDLRLIASNPEEIAREIHKGRGHQLRFDRRSGAQDVHDYAVGWCLSEYVTKDGTIVEAARPRVIARVYEAISERRLGQATTGFLPPRLVGCPQCGQCQSVAFELVPAGLLDHGAAPDAAFLARLSAVLSRSRSAAPPVDGGALPDISRWKGCNSVHT